MAPAITPIVPTASPIPTNPPPVPQILLLKVPEAAAALRLSRSKVYELIAARKICSVQIDGARRIPIDSLTAYIAELVEEAA